MNISFFLFHTKKIHDRATADDDDNNDDGFWGEKKNTHGRRLNGNSYFIQQM